MVDVMVDAELWQSFDKALFRTLIELYVESWQSSMQSFEGAL